MIDLVIVDHPLLMVQHRRVDFQMDRRLVGFQDRFELRLFRYSPAIQRFKFRKNVLHIVVDDVAIRRVAIQTEILYPVID